MQLINPSTSPNELNTTLTPHSIIHGDACFAYFNKIWGIPQYEDEYRLIAEEEDRAFDHRTLKTQDQFYKLPSGSLMSIIIGANAPDATRRTITNIVDRSGSNLRLRHATRAPDRYELLIDPPID